ncbi:MAG TPA: PQQ-binding-like beta-propeller repeat protein [Bryobacteraceae bacterium]|nr:PQQ-binding-like beta-propeller repeat protein [Bryobacteraceae bacterium]
MRASKWIGLCVCSLLAAPCFAQSFAELAKADPSNWFSYSGSFGGQRFSALRQIDTGNVDRLGVKWIFHVGRAQELEGVPVVAGGVMYVSQPNEVVALDARSGRMIWRYQRSTRNGGHNRGVAVYDQKVFVGTTDAYLVALDARTGNVIWETRMPGNSPRYQGGAPLAVNHKVIAGLYSTSGSVVAYDSDTGKVLWQWNAIPHPGEPGSETWKGVDAWKFGGGPTWLTGTYDPDLNLLYWGTGQANPDFIGDRRPGDNLYSECVVALDADTGKLKWYFQFTPHDVHDWDSVEIPILLDASYEGHPRKLLVEANRNGYYYVIDRTNGKFLHGAPFVHSLTWADGLTPEGRPIVVPGKEPTLTGNVVCPPTQGATNWPSPSYDPETHAFYLIATEGCSINYRGSENFQPTSVSSNGTGYIESPNEGQRWQNYVRALDALSGKLIWEYKQIGSNHYGPGLMSTAGGLVFAGDNQGVLTALDARAGKPLWHFSTGEKITASPMAYSVDGQEYIGLISGPNVIVFGLAGSQ